ncbi:molybdopterin molybdochelatase [Limimonas halophila]|uniref:Molybdopterin molybdenumtransferase n=1 Tax=Limimonas halophila TaxID=1082479 RepID=A0A1G7NA23_9PROT|nr:gephyrin-like molybdotransferase Glp [Limimonas halophila]SDF70883.1 molybdopterin molybdochelatase [Limimonas halophila]
MLSVADARTRILAGLRPCPSETVSVADGLGRVLATDVHARVDQPPRAVSAMDGYAVRSADVAETPAELRIVAEVPAGSNRDTPLAPGEAVRIFTGAPVPPEADAIVIQENAAREGDRVTVHTGSPAGKWVRPAGLDFARGERGLAAGRRLTARDVSLAAAMNHPWLSVHRRPRVAILATGDEVVLPGEPLGANQIVSSNSMGLAAFVRARGGEPVNLGIARDDPDALGAHLDAAQGCDLLVTIGGASVGEHDHVHSVLAAKGAEMAFWKIAMRPGKPLMFSSLAGLPVVGLPGNPVSVLVCAHIFLRPALDVLAGLGASEPPSVQAALGAPLDANGERTDHLRAELHRDDTGALVATPFARQDSSMLSRLAAADGLIVRAPHAPAAETGETVTVLPLDDGPGAV